MCAFVHLQGRYWHRCKTFWFKEFELAGARGPSVAFARSTPNSRPLSSSGLSSQVPTHIELHTFLLYCKCYDGMSHNQKQLTSLISTMQHSLRLHIIAAATKLQYVNNGPTSLKQAQKTIVLHDFGLAAVMHMSSWKL